MLEIPNDKQHIRVVFQTNVPEYVISNAKSFSVPKSVGPNELNDIINALLTLSHPVRMSFFIEDMLIQHSLADTLEATGLNCEDIIKVMYVPQVVPKRQNSVSHADWISSLAFVGDAFFLTGSYDFRIRCCRLDKDTASVEHEAHGHHGAITDVCLMHTESPQSFQCASASQDGAVNVWDYTATDGFKSHSSFRHHTMGVQSIAYAKQSDSLLSGGYEGSLCLWKPRSDDQPEYLLGHTNAVNACAFAEDQALSGSMDGTIKLWDCSSAQLLHSIDTTHGIHSIDTRPGDTLVLAGHTNCTVTLSDYRTSKSHATMRGHTKWVYAVAFGENGQFMSTGEDNAVCLWDMRFSRAPFFQSHSIHSEPALATLSCGGDTYATAGKDRKLVLTAFTS